MYNNTQSDDKCNNNQLMTVKTNHWQTKRVTENMMQHANT